MNTNSLNLLDDIKRHIQSVNQFRTIEELCKTDPIVLLRLCHPNYRSDYARKLQEQGSISLVEMNEFITRK